METMKERERPEDPHKLSADDAEHVLSIYELMRFPSNSKEYHMGTQMLEDTFSLKKRVT
jgi:hypothetical protein